MGTRWRLALVVALVLVAIRAQATTVMLSGFDVADDGATSDSFEFSETESGGSIVDADVKICVQGASCQTHNSLNGGSGTSLKAFRVDAAANAPTATPHERTHCTRP